MSYQRPPRRHGRATVRRHQRTCRGLDPARPTVAVAVDLENLLGPWWEQPSWRLRADCHRLMRELPENAFGYVAGHRTLLAMVADCFPHPWRLRPVAGTPEAADAALVADIETLPAAVTHVVIASGDHAFVDSTRMLRQLGCVVTVVSRADAMSRHLRAQADSVVPLTAVAMAAAA